jgi:dTDP-4-dehydrorhamnose 3,5-epimerase
MGREICNSHTRGENFILIFTKTDVKGAYIVELEKIHDERGFFARSWDKKEFEMKGIDSNLVQCSISFNKLKGTLRGIHYQKVPFEESKLVSCTKGKIFDVVIDLRPNSTSYKKWISVELTEQNQKMIFIPKGCAHGFQTLDDNTEVFYQISEVYNPESSRGIRWNDPKFNINWPLEISNISEKDIAYSLFKD